MSPTCPSQNKNFGIKDEIMATHFRWWGLFWPHFPQERITFFLIQKLYVCVFSQDRLIEWWFFLLFHCFFGDKYQINKPQHYNLQSWPCTSRSHDFERELTCVWFQCSYIEEFLLVYNLLRVYNYQLSIIIGSIFMRIFPKNFNRKSCVLSQIINTNCLG